MRKLPIFTISTIIFFVIHYYNFINILFSAATSGGSSEPAIDDLANHVAARIPAKWMKVAIQLRVGMSDISAIRKNDDECFDRFMSVFDHWERASTKPFTWKTLVDALKSRSVNEVKLADELHHMFCL